jgi:hypothetical protein
LGVCPSTTEKGFVFSLNGTNNNPEVGGTGVTQTAVAGLSTGAYSLVLTGLTASTTYAYKAYAYDGTTYTYGTVQTVTTTGYIAPSVSLPTSTAVGNTTATLGGTVTDDGGSAVTERGIVWSVTTTNADPVLGGTGVTAVTTSGTTGLFTINVTGLTEASGITFKAYATNSVGTSYSSASTITTTANATSLVFTYAPNVITAGSTMASFTVVAKRPDNTTDIYFTSDITISKASGSGNLSGTLTKTPVNGVATFNDLSIDAIDSYTLTANGGSLYYGFV